MNVMENRQFGSQMAMAVAPVRITNQVISNVHTIIGAALLGVGILVFALSFLFGNNAAILALRITGGALAFSGVVELAIAVIFSRLVRREHTKLARLKSEGRSFPGEIVQIKRHIGVRLGYSVSAYAECSYQNQDGKTCLVKSHSFLYRDEKFHWSSFGARDVSGSGIYSAWVYVNPYDPTDYAVEILAQTPQVDYDYR